jgi:peptidoglycan/xylan/chitin deacetylase (PgdA/CDA1 family)
MAKIKKKSCKNHPYELTSRKCYYCHEYICSDCQLRLDHHIFCSKKCHWRWKWQQFSEKMNLSKELISIAAVLLILNIIFFLYLNSKLDSIQNSLKEPVMKNKDEIESETQALHKIKFDTTRYPLKNVLQFRLYINDGAVAALKRDGRFVESQVQNHIPINFHNQFLNQGKNEFSIYLLRNDGNSSLIDSFTINFKSARVEYMRKYVERFKGDSNSIALTFDGGSSDNGTEKILNILRENEMRCTIFLAGDFLKNYPKLVKQMVLDGHEIGNHSYSHPHLTMLEKDGSTKTRTNVNRQFVHDQLLKTDSIFQQISGFPMAPLWRAPYGEINSEILLWAAEAGFKHIHWTDKCDTWDWVTDTTSSIYRTGPQILEHFLELDDNVGLGGKIILMHLGTERKKEIPNGILADLITKLRERGYKFKTIGQILTNS